MVLKITDEMEKERIGDLAWHISVLKRLKDKGLIIDDEEKDIL